MEPKSPSKLKLSIMGFSQFKGWFKMSIVFVVVVVLFLGAHLEFQPGEGGVVVVVLFLVKEHSFLYRKSWIRVLSGKEEAYYGWVALNYKGMFMNHSRLPTLGLLDLGGSSLQVVMEVDDVKEDTHYIRSKLGFLEHQILAYSLPPFGLNEAFDRTVVLLSHIEALRESNSGTLELRHPCFGSNFVQNYTCSGCFGLNVGGQKNVNQMWKTEYPSSFYLVRVPNWDECKILARAAATNSSSWDWSWSTAAANYKAKLCLDRGNGILNLTAIALTARFHALSGFFAVYDKLNLSPKANLAKIWEKGQHLCSRSWTNSGNDCFQVPYMASVIVSR